MDGIDGQKVSATDIGAPNPGDAYGKGGDRKILDPTFFENGDGRDVQWWRVSHVSSLSRYVVYQLRVVDFAINEKEG